jgi:hypothetical protein
MMGAFMLYSEILFPGALKYSLGQVAIEVTNPEA